MEDAMVTVVLVDMDRFSEKTRREGLNPYRPNTYTGTLSHLVDRLASKWSAQILYGLDWERGTEEAVLQVAGTPPDELAADLVEIAGQMCRLGAPVTIVAVSSPVPLHKPRTRREAYSGPVRRASRIMARLKRRGGGMVWVEGSVVYRCPRQSYQPPDATE